MNTVSIKPAPGFKSIRAALTVSRKEYITPHYIRVYLTGDDVPLFAEAAVGNNNKILIPPQGVDKIYFPEYDNVKKQWRPLADSVRPIVRTYTHRGIDLQRNEMWIDFVAHGDEGVASAWAIRAREGDVLGVMMKAGKAGQYNTEAANYLFVGDATAIPVIGAILEQLPPQAKGTCVIEVSGEEDEQPLATRADIRFRWLHNPPTGQESRLAEIVKSLPLPEQDRYAFVAAELSTVKVIRNYLRREKGWQPDEFYAYSYWKAGAAEDHSAEERRNEKKEEVR